MNQDGSLPPQNFACILVKTQAINREKVLLGLENTLD